MPDGYSVTLVSAARRELERLRDPVLQRVTTSLVALSGMPRPRGCKKLVGGESNYRLRVGNYRVVYGVDDGNRQVVVYRIRHRSQAYD